MNTITKWIQRKLNGKRAPVAGVRILGKERRFMRFADLRPDSDGITIGRAEKCDITIHHESISRVHCRIERGLDGSFSISDAESHNGVYVATHGPRDEHRKVTWERLSLGSFVYLGKVTIVPVTQRGRLPIVAWRHSEYLLNARAVYGSETQLEDNTGVTRSLYQRLVRWREASRSMSA